MHYISERYEVLTREQEIEAWERGDHETLAKSQIGWVVRICERVTRKSRSMFSEDDMEDVISVAMDALARSVQKYDARESRLTTWVTRPVRWRVMKELEKILERNKRCMLIDAAKIQASADVPVEREEDRLGLMEYMRSQIKRLKGRERHVIQGILKNKSAGEIAKELGVCKSTVGKIKKDVVEGIRKRYRLGSI